MLLLVMHSTVYAARRTTPPVSAVMVPRYRNAGRGVCRTIYLERVARFASLHVPPPRDPFFLEMPWHPQRANGAVDRTIPKSRGYRKAVVSKWRFTSTRQVHLKSGRTRPQRVPASTRRAGACSVGHCALTFSMWVSAQDPRMGASKLEIGLPARVSEG